jgi:hypothetical protein
MRVKTENHRCFTSSASIGYRRAASNEHPIGVSEKAPHPNEAKLFEDFSRPWKAKVFSLKRVS